MTDAHLVPDEAPPKQEKRPRVTNRRVSVRKIIRLQARLNATFVYKRDHGEPTGGIYSQLQLVERWLSRHRIAW
jgi:hypothetical protein